MVNPIPDGSNVVLAFDGSKNNDWTVLSVVLVDERPHVDVVKTWDPPSIVPPGWEVDILDVEETIRSACKRWNVLEVAADEAGWRRSLQVLASEGIPAVSFPQTSPRMTPATKLLHDLIVSQGLTQSGDPRLRRHMLNAVAKDDYRGYRIAKQSKDSPYKVDLAVTTVMGIDRAMTFVNAPTEYAHVFFASDMAPKQDEPSGLKIIVRTPEEKFKNIYDRWRINEEPSD